MILLALGIIIGIAITLMVVFVAISYRVRIGLVVEKVEEKKVFSSSETVEIFEPTDSSVEALEEVFEQNKQKGRDTKLE